jgi:hypothetical protein
MRYASLVVCVLLMSGCGGDSSPTAPTPTVPQVAGSYAGSVTVSFPEIPTSVNCPATTAVTQSGLNVNVAPLILAGQCGNLSIPMGAMTIDNTGALTGTTTGTVNDTCGVYNYTASGGFFGRELRISMNATSRTCYNFNFTAVLTR